jgi:hypothetical protein
MKKVLILIRSEADFERATCIGIALKEKYLPYFVFTGDRSPFYSDGIKNLFQKTIFHEEGFDVVDFSDFDFLGKVFKVLIGGKKIELSEVKNSINKIFPYCIYRIFLKYIWFRKQSVIRNLFQKTEPYFLMTDQSITHADYLPEEIRVFAVSKKIPVYLFTHGAAGGLHSEFSDPVHEPYGNYKVLKCNRNESPLDNKNIIITGDMASSFPYVNFLNQKNYYQIDFLNYRKYKIGFMMGGVADCRTSTNGWNIQEELIIELSENEDVAMVLKLHPREAQSLDLRMIKNFKNLLIVDRECDRSRVTKWADILVCSDHCSTIFEPMILGKKVVALEGKHIPMYAKKHSPLKFSSVDFITSAAEFNLDSIHSADPFDNVTNEIAWGNNGPIDLAKFAIQKIEAEFGAMS